MPYGRVRVSRGVAVKGRISGVRRARLLGNILLSGLLSSCFFELSDVVETAPDGSTGGVSGTAGLDAAGGSVGGAARGNGGESGDASAGIGGGPDVATSGTGGGAGTEPGDGADDLDAPDATVGDSPVRCASVCGTPGCGTCPTTPAITVGSFNIDAYEVTNAQYAAWLALDPMINDQILACEDNSSFRPDAPCADPPPSRLQEPVACVDWCDAYAYCTWAGRELCHDLGGGPLYFFDYDKAARSQWYAACSKGGLYQYPYGNSFDPLKCNGREYNLGSALDVGKAAGCEGGYPRIFHMSGNVAEWEYACTTASATAQCRVRGGSFADFSGSVNCKAPLSASRDTRNPEIGFRCCSAQ